MQVFINVRGSWRCVQVELKNGCVPCIGGTTLSEQQIEPALWFKVAAI